MASLVFLVSVTHNASTNGYINQLVALLHRPLNLGVDVSGEPFDNDTVPPGPRPTAPSGKTLTCSTDSTLLLPMATHVLSEGMSHLFSLMLSMSLPPPLRLSLTVPPLPPYALEPLELHQRVPGVFLVIRTVRTTWRLDSRHRYKHVYSNCSTCEQDDDGFGKQHAAESSYQHTWSPLRFLCML